jgi:dTDP-4-dehydrorhamnose reductase
VQIRRLLESGARGTVHATAEGYCTRYECARFILNKLGLKKKIKPCSMNDFQGKAKRPANCILENRMLKQQGINAMVGWEDDLQAFLERFGKEIIKEFKR